MSQQTVLIIGGRPENLRKAKACGLGVVHVQHPERFTSEHAAHVDAALLVDPADWDALEPLVLTAHKVYGFTSAVTTVEASVEVTGRINDLLGLDGVSHTVARRLRDKLSMREHLAAAGAPTVAAAEVTDRAGLAAFGARHGYPFIAKPVDGIGSLAVRLVENEADVDAAWEAIERTRGRDHQYAKLFPIGKFLMEEYIDGPEYSVEAFTFAGRHVVVAITEKLTDANFVERGHLIPARLDESAERTVEAAVVEFLDAVGVKEGPSHTELRLSSRGPRVIESHNRPGGDRIRDLVEAVYGFDFELYSVAGTSGALPALDARPSPRQGAATLFLQAGPGVVTAVEGAEEARTAEGVLVVDLAVEPGDVISTVGSSFDRPGQVIAVGADPDAALARCGQVCEAIRIRTRG
ncbi:ATP-grasp domain-containing protein [Streptomyces sp. AC602_WCS936]|uniref:ATP-grasp domain-containing protein n=1 Tax=Streptomyces sp. AC602_WCS936 TaxID=2823685 RepID=UPI001C26751E|nr:ATP-grasp domain-containing protein [Streptomyces sp. AC602_WCS936]